MFQYSRPVVALALLVVLAGCGAVPTGAGDGQSTTIPYPAGTDESGIVNEATVVSTHAEALSAQSYAITATQRVGDAQQTVAIRSNPDQMRTLATAAGSGQLAGTELYITDSAAYVKRGTGDAVQYAVQDPEVNFSAQHRRQVGVGYVSGVLDAGRFEPAGQSTVDGVPVWEFELVEYTGSQVLPANATEASGTVKIDGNGVVREAAVAVKAGDTPGTGIDIEYRVDQLGSVTVSEPDWLDEAKAQTGSTA